MSDPIQLFPARPSPWGPELSRRSVLIGSTVTAEDPTSVGFGRRGKVVGSQLGAWSGKPIALVTWDGDARSNEIPIAYGPGEIRDVRDAPPSAQLISTTPSTRNGGRVCVWDSDTDGEG